MVIAYDVITGVSFIHWKDRRKGCAGSLERSVPESPILMAQLNGLHEYAPDGC